MPVLVLLLVVLRMVRPPRVNVLAALEVVNLPGRQGLFIGQGWASPGCVVIATRRDLSGCTKKHLEFATRSFILVLSCLVSWSLEPYRWHSFSRRRTGGAAFGRKECWDKAALFFFFCFFFLLSG